jgi:mRNA-degrading endonuclease RelE of RelBE toxin-antitoxin system
MRRLKASVIMRTTIDIDDPILKDVKRLQKREGTSLGRLVSDLLAESLARRRKKPQRNGREDGFAGQGIAPFHARLELE